MWIESKSERSLDMRKEVEEDRSNGHGLSENRSKIICRKMLIILDQMGTGKKDCVKNI